MNIKSKYEQWLERTKQMPQLHEELASCTDEAQLFDRFYRNLEFGTGGLRGVLGAGTNRMNVFTVAKATRGFGEYLVKSFATPSCAIAYDSRNKSDEFAKIVAATLAQMGIKVHIYNQLMPTPMLSFAVRYLQCSGGVVITASHNPAKYNGYKVYGADGCQITLDAAEKVLGYIDAQADFEVLPSFDALLAAGVINYIDERVCQAYYKAVLAESLQPITCELNVVYSALNGAGNLPVRHILNKIGVKLSIVKEQEMPDGDFTTCPFPNPEIQEAMQLACNQLLKENADFCMATDPDCDRVGVGVIAPNGEIVLISGNEMGALLLDYICKIRIEKAVMPKNAVAVKTIVTTQLAERIAAHYNVEIRNVLTGFKFIGEQIAALEEKGEANRYIFGFEESYGYLSGTFVRDKDAVNASMLICEMAAYYKSQGVTILNALESLYAKFGSFKSNLLSFEFEGAKGMDTMNMVLNTIRNNDFKLLDGDILNAIDYENHNTGLPKSNVIMIDYSNAVRIVVRPSGTEPKLKIYTTVSADTMDNAAKKLNEIDKKCTQFIQHLI